MIPAPEALERLRAGNRRFVSYDGSEISSVDQFHRREMVSGQRPFAVVLGCADSRVPPEFIFDQGPGSLFVVRVAGNIATPAVIGSIEYAAEFLGTRLVVVMGHSHCGAVETALAEIEQPTPELSPSLQAIVDFIRPVIAGQPTGIAVRANVIAGANALRRESAVLKPLIEKSGLVVVGAEYSLATGVVDFFDGVPGTD